MFQEDKKMKIESIIATLIGVIGTILFTVLLEKGIINTLSYISLLGLTALVSLVLHGFKRITELDIKNLKVTLSQIKEAKRDLYAKAESVKKFGEDIAEITAYHITRLGRWAPDDLEDRILTGRNKIINFLRELGSEEKTIAGTISEINDMILSDLKTEINRKVVKDSHNVENSANINEDVKKIVEKYSLNGSKERLMECLKKNNLYDEEYILHINRLGSFISKNTFPPLQKCD